MTARGDVTVLYSYDTGVHDFQPAVRAGLSIAKPPNRNGPLFMHDSQSKVVPIRKPG